MGKEKVYDHKEKKTKNKKTLALKYSILSPSCSQRFRCKILATHVGRVCSEAHLSVLFKRWPRCSGFACLAPGSVFKNKESCAEICSWCAGPTPGQPDSSTAQRASEAAGVTRARPWHGGPPSSHQTERAIR